MIRGRDPITVFQATLFYLQTLLIRNLIEQRQRWHLIEIIIQYRVSIEQLTEFD